jgi:hypothetical protein
MHRTITAIILVGIHSAIFVGCEDKSMVNIYDKSIITHPPSCLALSVIPEEKSIENAIRDRFEFDPKCPWRLEVKYKNDIHCNSNQNSDRKALSSFPVSYLRMEIRRGMQMVYSYYIDLQKQADADDATRGISRIIDDVFKK